MAARVSTSRPRAFTVAEVLVVIALIGVAAGLAVAALTPAGAADRATDADILRTAVAAARDAGAERRVTLAYDAARAALVLRDTRELAVFPLAAAVSLTLPESDDRTATDAIVFSPAGDATPVRITLFRDGVSAAYRLEPFSAALAAESP